MWRASRQLACLLAGAADSHTTEFLCADCANAVAALATLFVCRSFCRLNLKKFKSKNERTIAGAAAEAAEAEGGGGGAQGAHRVSSYYFVLLANGLLARPLLLRCQACVSKSATPPAPSRPSQRFVPALASAAPQLASANGTPYHTLSHPAPCSHRMRRRRRSGRGCPSPPAWRAGAPIAS